MKMQQILSGCGFLTGLSYPFRTLALFKRTPHLWGYLIAPILVNIFLGIAFYVGLLLLSWEAVYDLMLSLSDELDKLIATLPYWLSILEYLLMALGFLLQLLSVVILMVVTGFLFAQFGVILGAPWYGKLSEKLEKIRLGQANTIEVGIFTDISRAILFELKKLTLIAAVAFPLLFISFLPGIGTLISTTGGLILTGTIVCLDFFDSPLERRRLSFRDKLGIVWGSLPASAGFSLVCLGLISVPLLNLITIPICVASGTLFFCDRIFPKRFQSYLPEVSSR